VNHHNVLSSDTRGFSIVLGPEIKHAVAKLSSIPDAGSFDAPVYYCVPRTKRKDVKVLRDAGCLKIYQHRTCAAEYAYFAIDGTPFLLRRYNLRPFGRATDCFFAHHLLPRTLATNDVFLPP
jgi:hypothetical protein